VKESRESRDEEDGSDKSKHYQCIRHSAPANDDAGTVEGF